MDNPDVMIEFSKAQFASFTDVQAATSATSVGAMINLGNGSSLFVPRSMPDRCTPATLRWPDYSITEWHQRSPARS